jgi:hypothetical protein
VIVVPFEATVDEGVWGVQVKLHAFRTWLLQERHGNIAAARSVLVFGVKILRRAVLQKFTDVSDVLNASIIRAMIIMIERIRCSETFVGICKTTRRIVTEDVQFYTGRWFDGEKL